MAGYWRSLACRAWAAAAGAAGGFPGPVQVNLPLRDPLVPGMPDAGQPEHDPAGWPEPLDGRPGGVAWTRLAGETSPGQPGALELPWTERGVLLAGDGAVQAGPLAALAEAAGWPVLAEPSSGARRGRAALTAYQYLLDDPTFTAAHRPDLVISAGRPGLSRGQLGFLRQAAGHGPGTWC